MALSSPFYWPVNFFGCPGKQGLFSIMKRLTAKATPYIWSNYTDLVLRDSEDECTHQQSDQVRVLRAGIESICFIGSIVRTNITSWLNSIWYKSLIYYIKRSYVCRFCYCLIHF